MIYSLFLVLHIKEIVILFLVYLPSEEIQQYIPTNSIILAPLKLPMIVEPKAYDIDILGGYLLNDEEYADSMVTAKTGMKQSSTILSDNIIYYSVNNMMKTAFKINKNLLTYLIKFNREHNLLVLEGDNIYKNINIIDMESKEKKLYQQYFLLRSTHKKLLHDYIIRIAITYRNIPEIFYEVPYKNG